MRLTREQILTIGPVVLVAACYAIAAPAKDTSNQITASPTETTEIDGPTSGESVSSRCQSIVVSLKKKLPADWNFLIREPFVLGGDFPVEDIEQKHHQTIVPITHALGQTYFLTPPLHPTTILICSNDDQFRKCNIKLDSQDRSQYSGIYCRRYRRVIVNIASGDGTLAHELTHAMAHADFPTMPEWFDEGLASLHEECEFSQDGRNLIGNENWRNEVAFEMLNRGELRLIEDVTSKRFGSADRANADYAHVRSLCLYLQEKGHLESFYQSCRRNSTDDPTGLRSLCRIANTATPRAFDDGFRAWLISRNDHRSSN